MTTLRNPADDAYEFKKLWDAIRDLQSGLNAILTSRSDYFQTATVSTYTGGSFCTVTFSSGATKVLSVPVGYTPAVGHVVLVGIGQYASSILLRLS